MEIEIGHVTHFYSHLSVAVLALTDELKAGDTIHILGHVTDFMQPVGSMEIEHHSIKAVNPGEEVAIKVAEPVRVHDMVYKVVEGIFEHLGT